MKYDRIKTGRRRLKGNFTSCSGDEDFSEELWKAEEAEEAKMNIRWAECVDRISIELTDEERLMMMTK